eukprot:s6899_g3.t1
MTELSPTGNKTNTGEVAKDHNQRLLPLMPDKRYVCDDKVDASGNAFKLEDAIKLCKAKAPFLHRAEWDRKGCKNDDECRVDFILGACDVCNAEPNNRVAVAKNAGDQDPRRSPKDSADRCVAERLGLELCHELTPDAEHCTWDAEAVMKEKDEYCEDHICEDASLLQRSESDEVGMLQRRSGDGVTLAANNTVLDCSHRVHFCQRLCHGVLDTKLHTREGHLPVLLLELSASAAILTAALSTGF